jgi:hypothetical protein
MLSLPQEIQISRKGAKTPRDLKEESTTLLTELELSQKKPSHVGKKIIVLAYSWRLRAFA